MTCRELRKYLEREREIGSRNFRGASEIEEHVSLCKPCHSYVQEHEQTRENLRFVRDAAPAVPASLDRVVLTNYRELVRELARTRERSRKGARPLVFGALAWTAAAALALIVSYGEIALFLRGDHGRSWSGTQTPAPVFAPGIEPKHNSVAELRPPGTKLELPAEKRILHLEKQEPRRPQIAEQSSSQPVDFQGLMYCDELSCGGTMEVIRMRVPAEALGIGSAVAPTNDLISADVLVGPDGIARGIRVAE
jgi:hypothetical protein